MDKEQIAQLIEKLLSTGEFLASKGYEIALKQVVVDARYDLYWGLFLAILGVIFILLVIKFWADIDDGVLQSVILLLSLIPLLFGINTIIYSMKVLSNPDWYAVKLLVETFLR